MSSENDKPDEIYDDEVNTVNSVAMASSLAIDRTSASSNRPDHPDRSQVRPIYNLNAIPRSIRTYLISAFNGDLPSLRIVRSINTDLLRSKLATIGLFDLYSMLLELYVCKAIANSRPIYLANEMTITQFASFFKEWMKGGSRDQCYSIAKAVDANHCTASFASKMFAAMSTRKREMLGVCTPSKSSPVHMREQVASRRLDAVDSMFNYAGIAQIHGVPSIVIPLESEVLDAMQVLSKNDGPLDTFSKRVRMFFEKLEPKVTKRKNETFNPPPSCPPKPIADAMRGVGEFIPKPATAELISEPATHTPEEGFIPKPATAEFIPKPGTAFMPTTAEEVAKLDGIRARKTMSPEARRGLIEESVDIQQIINAANNGDVDELMDALPALAADEERKAKARREARRDATEADMAETAATLDGSVTYEGVELEDEVDANKERHDEAIKAEQSVSMANRLDESDLFS